jgi:hypothetical protein
MLFRSKKYHWVNTRCAARNSLDPEHAEVLMECTDRATVFPACWHSFFTAQVPQFIAEYNQIENDNDRVYLLQMISKPQNNRYRIDDE